MDWYNGVRLGSALPDFDAEYLDQAPATERKLLLVDFWATWCAPCREEFPHLNALNSRFSGQGLAVVGLTQESKAVAQAFLPKAGIQYSVGAGGTRPLQKALGIKALPYAILVDRGNKIVWRGQASTLSAAEVENRLKSAA
ncbi:MAG: TlpA disulfide reductase family protein [Rubrivivax sp.]|nr:TlpA disulfide reductase family protein [Rubrivivax sp.]MDP3084696.1 TlpA disulfide reductase family protein [Rubrivivax sp.]